MFAQIQKGSARDMPSYAVYQEGQAVIGDQTLSQR